MLLSRLLALRIRAYFSSVVVLANQLENTFE